MAKGAGGNVSSCAWRHGIRFVVCIICPPPRHDDSATGTPHLPQGAICDQEAEPQQLGPLTGGGVDRSPEMGCQEVQGTGPGHIRVPAMAPSFRTRPVGGTAHLGGGEASIAGDSTGGCCRRCGSPEVRKNVVVQCAGSSGRRGVIPGRSDGSTIVGIHRLA